MLLTFKLKFNYHIFKAATNYYKLNRVSIKKYKIYFFLIFLGLICCKKGVVNDPKVPIVNSNKLTSSTYNTFTVSGAVVDDGGATITERGICYKAGNNPTIIDAKIIDTGTVGQFSATLTKLLFNTNYTYKAYAINAVGVGYGAEMTFTTGKDTSIKIITKPTVSINNPTLVSTSNCSISGFIVSNGGSVILTKGFCYSNTTNNPSIGDSIVYNVDTSNVFSNTINGLDFNSTYYICAFTSNQAGITYSNVISFKTALPTIASVLTNSANSGSFYGAIITGSIVSTGGAPITEKGVCISKNTGPTINNLKILSTDTGKFFTVKVNNLLSNTVYYARVYAINAGGIAYGNEVTFTTLAFNLTGTFLKLKIVNNSAATNIDSTHYFYDSAGRLTNYDYTYQKYGVTQISFNYSGNSIYPYSSLYDNFKYNNFNQLIYDSSTISGWLSIVNFNYTNSIIDGNRYQHVHITPGGFQDDTWINNINIVNDNVDFFNFKHIYEKSTTNGYTKTIDYDSAKYTYTSYLNPEYNVKAYIVEKLAGMYFFWNMSNNMPLTESRITIDASSIKISNTSIYTYTLDMMGRVSQQTQTKSTGEVIVTDYKYY